MVSHTHARSNGRGTLFCQRAAPLEMSLGRKLDCFALLAMTLFHTVREYGP
jgi:hypothetical protein